MRDQGILGATGLMCCAAVWPSGGLAKDTKVVLLAGTKSHLPGERAYEKGMNLLRHGLDTSLNVNEPPLYACGTGMKITVGDLNADGRLDVVVAGRGGLYAFVNRGLTPILKGSNPKVPLIGEKRPDLK